MFKNFNLQSYNSFGFDISCSSFAEVNSATAIEQLYASPEFNHKRLILGGGSNVLFTENFSGLVIWNQIKGIEHVKEDGNFVWLKVGAGVVWHEFVMHCVASNLGGIENLSLIPGYVGAAPMQNIGAYGSEIKDTCTQVDFFDFTTGKHQSLSANECEFDYRESVFKHALKDKVFITHVYFKLHKHPEVNTHYGAITSKLEHMGVKQPGIRDVSQAVISIRQEKLPDPAEIGNAGSFFKNPYASAEQVKELLNVYPHMPHYPVGKQYKLAAGWLIEQCGWKGKTKGSVGVHKNQALVLVHYGKGKGKDLLKLSEAIQKDVYQKFGIRLVREVNLVL